MNDKKSEKITFNYICEEEGDIVVFITLIPFFLWLAILATVLTSEGGLYGLEVCFIVSIIITILVYAYYSNLKEKHWKLYTEKRVQEKKQQQFWDEEEKQNERRKEITKKKYWKRVEMLLKAGGTKNLQRATNLLNKLEANTETTGLGELFGDVGQDSSEVLKIKKKKRVVKMEIAKEMEKLLKYEEAIDIWEELGNEKEAKRLRQKIINHKKVDQTVIQGDQITRTEIKDSVVNKSNVGGGGSSKAEELREAKALLDEGIIDDDEFKQMKKEILGK